MAAESMRCRTKKNRNSQMAFVKVHREMLDSSVWIGTSADVKVLWVVMLVMADQNGEVRGGIPALMKHSELPRERCLIALDVLLSPDPDSKSQTADGRRIEEIDRGWRIVNYYYYRRLCSAEEKRRKDRERISAKRADARNHFDEARELEQTRRTKPPEAPPYKPEAPCCDCDSGPMVLRKSKYEDGSGWYYHCNVCGVNCDAGAYGDRWRHNKGATGVGGAEWCPRCGKMRLPDGDTLCVYCQQDGVV